MSLTPNASDAATNVVDSGAKQKPTKHYDAIADVPDKPAVYALCSRHRNGPKIAYVGETADLRRRLREHLVTRDSGIIGSERAVSINPDAITVVYWWEDRAFTNDIARKAAELIATEQFHPIMRSDNAVDAAAKEKAKLDAEFSQRMAGKFCFAAATGILTIRTLDDLSAQTDEIMTLIAKLEKRVEQLEKALAKQK
jgi:NADPH:quinone reductase-like Zn-dependent oxidoreductase